MSLAPPTTISPSIYATMTNAVIARANPSAPAVPLAK